MMAGLLFAIIPPEVICNVSRPNRQTPYASENVNKVSPTEVPSKRDGKIPGKRIRLVLAEKILLMQDFACGEDFATEAPILLW